MSPEHGAYGLTFRGPPVGPEWWNVAPTSWTPWEIMWKDDLPTEAPIPFVGRDRAWLRVLPSGFAEFDRARSRTILFGRRTSDHGFVHPHCGSSAVLHAAWQGWESFHAGGFVIDGRVWGFLGQRGSGKSSALAWLYASGREIFSDDLMVVRDGFVLAGPRCLDLREESACRFEIGQDVGVVGTRQRWRARLSPVPAELPLGGWVVLRWGQSEPRIWRATPAECLAGLIANRALLTPRNDAHLWLDLISAPTFVLERPREWARFDDTMARLVGALDSAT